MFPFALFSFCKCRDSQCFMLRSAALCLADASQLTTLMKADRFKVLPQSIKSLTSPWAKGAKFHHVRFTSVTLESHPRVPSTETCHIISNIPMICHQPKASTKSAGYWRNPALTSSFSMGVRVTPILFKTLQSPLILKAAWWSVAYIAYRPIESVSPKVLERMWFGCLFLRFLEQAFGSVLVSTRVEPNTGYCLLKTGHGPRNPWGARRDNL